MTNRFYQRIAVALAILGQVVVLFGFPLPTSAKQTNDDCALCGCTEEAKASQACCCAKKPVVEPVKKSCCAMEVASCCEQPTEEVASCCTQVKPKCCADSAPKNVTTVEESKSPGVYWVAGVYRQQCKGIGDDGSFESSIQVAPATVDTWFEVIAVRLMTAQIDLSVKTRSDQPTAPPPKAIVKT